MATDRSPGLGSSQKQLTSAEETEIKTRDFVEGQFDDASETEFDDEAETVDGHSFVEQQVMTPGSQTPDAPNSWDIADLYNSFVAHYTSHFSPPVQSIPVVLSPNGMPWTEAPSQDRSTGPLILPCSSQQPTLAERSPPSHDQIEGNIKALETIIRAAVNQPPSHLVTDVSGGIANLPSEAGPLALEFSAPGGDMRPVASEPSPGIVRLNPIVIPPSPILPRVQVSPVSEDREKKNGIEDGDVTIVDVLSGRGGLTNSHRGNERWRQLVAFLRPKYESAPKAKKADIAMAIVFAIRANHGRFLKRDDDEELWYEIGDDKAKDKTQQQLREGRAKCQRETSVEPSQRQRPPCRKGGEET